VEFGVHLPHSGLFANPIEIRRVGLEAEKLGYDCVWVHDHISYGPNHLRNCWKTGLREQFRADSEPLFFDSLITLAYLAGITERIRLGVSIIVLPIRNVLAVGRQLISLQSFSRGRLIAGVGVGDSHEDFAAVGVDYKERGARTEESIQVLKKIFTGGTFSHHGVYYNFERADFYPIPAPIPLYIGGGVFLKGGTEKDVLVPRVLDRVARFADGWIPECTLQSIHEGREYLDAALLKYGRPKDAVKITYICTWLCLGNSDEEAQKLARYSVAQTQMWKDTIRTTNKGMLLSLIGSPKTIIRKLEEYHKAGIDGVSCGILAADPSAYVATVRRFASEVMPSFRD